MQQALLHDVVASLYSCALRAKIGWPRGKSLLTLIVGSVESACHEFCPTKHFYTLLATGTTVFPRVGALTLCLAEIQFGLGPYALVVGLTYIPCSSSPFLILCTIVVSYKVICVDWLSRASGIA
jgi:hypothetical protein